MSFITLEWAQRKLLQSLVHTELPRILASLPPGDAVRVQTELSAKADLLLAYKPPEAIETDKTVEYHAKKWLAMEEGKVKNGELSAGRWQMVKIRLQNFIEFIGAKQPVTLIDGRKWSEWYAHLSKREWSNVYEKQHIADAKRFVTYLFEQELIEKPRNLDTYHFDVANQEIIIFTVDEVRSLISSLDAQERLWVLLMLNCGMTGKDISDLTPNQVDWEKGIIRRKRSKTVKHKSAPMVSYQLWDETIALLRKHGKRTGDHVLVDDHGKSWIMREIENGKYKISDKIGSRLKRRLQSLNIEKPVKALRATSATILQKEYPQFADYFLAHAPRNIGEKHYIKPDDEQFFQALKWLEQQYIR